MKVNLNDVVWKDRSWGAHGSYQKFIVFDGKDFDCPGVKLQVLKFEPGDFIGPHHHNQVRETFHVLKGDGVLKLNDQEFRCQPGDIYICQPGDIHEFKNDTNQDWIISNYKANEVKGDMHWD